VLEKKTGIAQALYKPGYDPTFTLGEPGLDAVQATKHGKKVCSRTRQACAANQSHPYTL
jgi:hypothetical protein